MASPNTLELARQRRALRSNIQITVADHPGNRATRRQAARDLQKRLKRGHIYGTNEKKELVILEKKRTGISFHECLNKINGV